MISVGVIGGNGYIGSKVYKELVEDPRYNVKKFGRRDKIDTSLDVYVYSANSSARFAATQNPEKDYMDTVEKFSNIYKSIKDKKVVLISTVSSRVQLNTPYGRHRRTCELMIDSGKDLVIRLGPMYSEDNPKGAVHDIVKNNTVYVKSSTQYSYTHVSYNAKKIVEMLNCTGLREIGACNSIELGHLALELGSQSKFVGDDDTQIMQNMEDDSPDAFSVISFAKKMLNSGRWNK
jgi:nucleoside-diphosphate-sugar epimerase